MTNTFTVDYATKTLSIAFAEGNYWFDLTQGDIGDFWDGFVTSDGKEWDINFHQEDETCEPTVEVYPAVWVGDENGSYDIDTNNGVLLSCVAQSGNAEEYFRFVPARGIQEGDLIGGRFRVKKVTEESVLPPMHYETKELSNRELKQTVAIIIAKIEACGIGAWNANLENTVEAVACEDYYGDVESNEPTVKYNGWFEDLQRLKEIL